jgi:hypothetical protein
MLFNSLSFAIFLPIVFAACWLINKNLRVQNFLLFVSSCYFYGSWGNRFLFILLFSISIYYLSGIQLEKVVNRNVKKFWFCLSLSVNLGFLGLFKYYNFFEQSFAEFLSNFGIRASFWTVKMIFSFKNIAKDERMGGYLHLVRDKTDSLLQASLLYARRKPPDMSVSPVNLIYLRKIIEMCKERGVRVILIRSPLHPVYDGFKNKSRYKQVLNNEFNDVEFLNLRNFPLRNSDYGDLEHLNYRRAGKYSLFFNRLLKGGLLDSANKQKFINDQMALEK